MTVLALFPDSPRVITRQDQNTGGYLNLAKTQTSPSTTIDVNVDCDPRCQHLSRRFNRRSYHQSSLNCPSTEAKGDKLRPRDTRQPNEVNCCQILSPTKASMTTYATRSPLQLLHNPHMMSELRRSSRRTSANTAHKEDAPVANGIGHNTDRAKDGQKNGVEGKTGKMRGNGGSSKPEGGRGKRKFGEWDARSCELFTFRSGLILGGRISFFFGWMNLPS